MSEKTDGQTRSGRMNMNTAVRNMGRGNKTGGIIIAICMIVLGILLWIRPLVMGAVLAYIATIGFVLYGIFQIVVYVRTESEYRNGWTLANGIIFIALGVLMLFSGPLATMEMFVFVLAFLALFGGINQITSYSALKKAGEPGAGWVLASGIINIILGIMLIVMPLLSVWMIDVFLGVYLLIGGVAFLIEVLSGQYGRKV
ncbi:DUF308 domain-containing protein [Christensenellaceae bacterium OttesenSCG-928-K19]|nr:DUF308 domain-containing protein [Christensenellaceae bacterium OttesenSCG-928-K19]